MMQNKKKLNSERVCNINYHKIINGDLCNGPGLRVSIWLSGCPHKCPGCFAMDTWDKHSGSPLTKEVEDTLLDYLKNPHIKGITFLGGEPLAPWNYSWVLDMAKRVKALNKNVVVYTGYSHKQVPYELDKYVDIYIDGKFVEPLKTNTAGKGSSNQIFWFKTKENKFEEREELYNEDSCDSRYTYKT